MGCSRPGCGGGIRPRWLWQEGRTIRCGREGSSIQRVVKIGHAAPLTGGIAHLGKDNENGVRLAIEEANAKGLTIGGEKVAFEMLSEDDEGKENKGPIIAQKFVDAKVAGVVGHLNSGVTIPASAVYNQAGIPMISGSATNPKLTEQGFKVAFRTVGRDDQQGPAIASYLVSEHKPKSVAVIDDATAYGEGLANEVEKTLKASGVNVLPREKGTTGNTRLESHSDQAERQGSGCDFLRRHGFRRRPADEAGTRTGLEGRVLVWRRGLHGQDEGTGRRCIGRSGVLAGGHSGAGVEQGIP